MILGISGKAGSGKDTVADLLVQEFGFVKVGLADPLKRIAKEVFDFSDDQMWGPSAMRNAPDKRYPRGFSDKYAWLCDPCARAAHGGPYEEKSLGRLTSGACTVCAEVKPGSDLHYVVGPDFLTPRHALQQLGTEWGRACYPNVWVDYATRVAKRILTSEEGFNYPYDARNGINYSHMPTASYEGVVISDVRFQNEVTGLSKHGAKLLRIRRPSAGLEGSAGQHVSETEQDNIPDSDFDAVLQNDGTIADLFKRVRLLMALHKKSSAVAPSPAKISVASLPAAPTVSIVTARKVEIDVTRSPPADFTHTFPQALARQEDGSELLAGAETQAEMQLRGLFEKRAEDVKNGRLMEYDETQSNVPPHLRKKPQ